MLKIEALIWISFWRALKYQHCDWKAYLNLGHQWIFPKKYKTHIKIMHDLHGTCFKYNEIMMKQPSNSTSWSDNALRLLVIVAVFQVSKMLFQSTNSIAKLFRLTLINASSVSRFRHVLFSLLTQFCFEKPRTQTTMLVGSQVWLAIATLGLANWSQTLGHGHQKPKLHAYFSVDKLKVTSPQIRATPHWFDQQEHSSTCQTKT